MSKKSSIPLTKVCIKHGALKPIVPSVRAGILGLCVISSCSHAATITVNSLSDSPSSNSSFAECTLRNAIMSLNLAALEPGCSNSSIHTEEFGVNDAIYFTNNVVLGGDVVTLEQGELFIAPGKNIVINASTVSENGLAIDANKQSRVLSINSATLSLERVIITGGHTGLNLDGAGIFANNAALSLSNSRVSGNTAFDLFAGGGGIHATVNSVITLMNSTVSNNYSRGQGGGISVVSSDVSLINSTVSGNSVLRFEGGGIYASSGASIILTNSTVSNNLSSRANNAGGVYVGSSSSTLISTNSIIANSSGGPDCIVSATAMGSAPNIEIDEVSIIEDGSCNTRARSVDPKLGPLSHNGGGTETHALLNGSPAINTGDLSTCTETDQLGNLRIAGDDLCSVGAVDFFRVETNFFVIPLENGKTVVFSL